MSLAVVIGSCLLASPAHPGQTANGVWDQIHVALFSESSGNVGSQIGSDDQAYTVDPGTKLFVVIQADFSTQSKNLTIGVSWRPWGGSWSVASAIGTGSVTAWEFWESNYNNLASATDHFTNNWDALYVETSDTDGNDPKQKYEYWFAVEAPTTAGHYELAISEAGDVDGAGDDCTISQQVDITVANPLTSVSNSPSPATISDTSTHAVSFTLANDLPADGKIVVTFPNNFNLAGVGSGDASSLTIDGTLTVSQSGQVLTITRSGGSIQYASEAETISIANIGNIDTVDTTYTVTVTTQDSSGTTINGPTTSSAFTITGKSALANPAIQVADQLAKTGSTQPTDVELVGFKITPTGENLTWSGLVVSLTYSGGMADADITNGEIYIDTGSATVGTYDGTETKVGSTVSASSGTLTWSGFSQSISAATDYLIIFDAGASLSTDETVQASVTAANITVTGATSLQSITSSGSVNNEPLHTVTSCGSGQFAYRRSIVIDYTKVGVDVNDNSGCVSDAGCDDNPPLGFPVLNLPRRHRIAVELAQARGPGRTGRERKRR